MKKIFLIIIINFIGNTIITEAAQNKKKHGSEEPRPSAYRDFIAFMEEYNFSSGGPETSPDVTCNFSDQIKKRAACNTREIFAEFKEQFPEDQNYIYFSDGTVLENPYYQHDNDESRTTFTQGRDSSLSEALRQAKGRTPQEAYNQIESVKQSFIKTIANGASENNLTQTQKQMIERINRLKFTINDEQCEGAFAAFKPASFQITACSLLLKMPEYAMVPILAHEMGHSLDFCNGSHSCLSHGEENGSIITPLEKEELLQNFLNENPNTDKEELTIGFNSYIQDVLEITNANATSERLDPSLSPDVKMYSVNSLQDFYKKMLENKKVSKVDSGIPFQELPITAPQSCLSQNFHMSEVPSDLESLCQGTAYTERGAQTWAAMVTGQYVEDNPPISYHQKLALMAVSIKNFTGKYADSWDFKEADFNTLYLSSKKIQDAFNCEPLPTQNCLP